MRTPEEVRDDRTGATTWVVRVLAVIGALAVAAVVVGGAVFLMMSRPGDVDPSTRPDAISSPGPSTAVDSPDPTERPTPGDLRSGEAWLPDVDVVTERFLADGIELRDVHFDGKGARTGGDGQVTFDQLDVAALVPYSAVENQVGNGVRLSPGGDGLVRARVPISAFGRSIDVTADARVHPEGDRIAIDPVRVADAGFLDGALERIPAIRQPVPNLPDGMRITTIDVQDEGFRFTATGQNVTIKR